MSRVDLAERLGLVKSGQSDGTCDVMLPQVFLTLTTKSGDQLYERTFLGYYETVQYLEDCGILLKILTGSLCAHYRRFKGHVFYQWCRPLEKLDSKVEICSTCHLQEKSEYQERLVIVGNFMAGQCSKTHDFSIFFEGNRIPFTCIDPANTHLKPQQAAFLSQHGIPLEPINIPKIMIHNKVLKIPKICEYATKGVLYPILLGQRCMTCLQKRAGCRCIDEPETKYQSLQSMMK